MAAGVGARAGSDVWFHTSRNLDAMPGRLLGFYRPLPASGQHRVPSATLAERGMARLSTPVPLSGTRLPRRREPRAEGRGNALAATIAAGDRRPSYWPRSAWPRAGSGIRPPMRRPSPLPRPPATPTPIPTPDPPVSASCAQLPAGATKYKCRTEAATFQADLKEAIDAVKREHPEAFDGDNVRNVGLYVVEVIKAFDRKGICADWDGEELGVATSRDYNDQYDILTARSQVRRYFVGTCYPSVIPVRRRSPPRRPRAAACPRAARSPAGTRTAARSTRTSPARRTTC